MASCVEWGNLVKNMNKALAVFVVSLLLASSAWAEGPVTPTGTGASTAAVVQGAGPTAVPMAVFGGNTPNPVTGFGTLALTNASTALSTMTAGPNSAAWPTTPGMMYVINDATSAGTMYVCPLGGVCTVANGLPLLQGQSYGFYKPATAMTAIAVSTATVKLQW